MQILLPEALNAGRQYLNFSQLSSGLPCKRYGTVFRVGILLVVRIGGTP